MKRYIYKRLLRRKEILEEEVKALVAKWSKITGITVERITRSKFARLSKQTRTTWLGCIGKLFT